MIPVRKASMRRPRRNKLREYSKRVLGAMIVLWFVGALFGAAVVVRQVTNNAYMTDLSSLLMYIGGPMTGGIVSYLVKSALENREKIKQSADTQYPADNTYIP